MFVLLGSGATSDCHSYYSYTISSKLRIMKDRNKLFEAKQLSMMTHICNLLWGQTKPDRSIKLRDSVLKEC